MKRVVLVRFGELTLRRGYARRLAERLLVRNVMDALVSAGLKARVSMKFTRVVVEAGDLDAAVDTLRRVFGVSSISIATETRFSDLDDLARKVVEISSDRVRGKSFAVRARRAGRHSFTSMDVARVVGAHLLPYASRVDLTHPDVEVFVEVRGNLAYIFYEKVRGAGGLPIGVEAPALALVSGGFDSAVAAWYMLKRGVPIHYIFFNLGGEPHFIGAYRVVKHLADSWSYGYDPKLYVADFRGVVRRIRRRVDQPYWNLVLKRLMYRFAERLAREVGAKALVTGESVGQVSSQTVAALHAISKPIGIPIFRPLIGFDKEEIIEVSRRIGTYGYSELIPEYCSIVPKAPISQPTVEDLDREEAKVPFNFEEVELETYRPRVEAPVNLSFEGLDVEEVPEDAVLVDVRDRSDYEEWHLPGAVHIDDLELQPGKKYVFYCSSGKSSRLVAAYYRWRGYEAYSLRGGLGRIRSSA